MSDFRYAVGSFDRILTTGHQTVSVADVSGAFQIKGIIFWSTGQSATGASAAGRSSVGFTDGTRDKCTSAYKPDDFLGSPSPQHPRAYSTNLSCIAFNTGAPTTISDTASIVSLGSGSFTINWDLSDGSALKVNYLAIGGADIHCQVGSFLNPASTGHQTVTTTGLGNLSAVVMMNVYNILEASTGVATIGWSNYPNFSFISGTAQAAYAGHSGNFPPTNTESKNYQRINKSVLIFDSGNPGVVKGEAELVSLGANQFVLDWTIAAGLGPYGNAGTHYLAISGPQIKVGSLTQPIVTGIVDTSLAFNPGALLVVSSGQVAATTPVNDLGVSIGAYDGVNHALSWIGDRDNVNPSQAANEFETNRIVSCNEITAVNGAITNKSFASAILGINKFSLNWQTVDTVLRELLYIAFEGPAGSAQGKIVVGKASVLVNDQEFTMLSPGLSPVSFTIGFEGTQEFTVIPGIYSISEVITGSFFPTYYVSNDPVENDNTHIVVNDGDLIDVVIVNTSSTRFGGIYQLVPAKRTDSLRQQDGTIVEKRINWLWKLFLARDK